MTTGKKITLEEKLTRLTEIQNLLENKKVNLTQSMVLLEEALALKVEIEKEIQEMENKLIKLASVSGLDKTEENQSTF